MTLFIIINVFNKKKAPKKVYYTGSQQECLSKRSGGQLKMTGTNYYVDDPTVHSRVTSRAQKSIYQDRADRSQSQVGDDRGSSPYSIFLASWPSCTPYILRTYLVLRTK
jgi:hypothetical protein